MSNALLELKKILSDIRDKAGCDVRLSPRGEGETSFFVNYCGTQVEVWIDGEERQTEQIARLVQYLVSSADARQLFPEKEEALKNILLGEGGGWYAYRFMTKYGLPEHACYAIDFQVDRLREEAIGHIESCLSDAHDMVARMDEWHFTVVKYCENGQSVVEYAQFLAQSLYEEIGVKASVGVGGAVKSFVEIATSYLQAATALRMSGIFHSKGEVHSYKEYLLVRVLEDVPESRLREYFEQLQISNGNEIFEDEELVSTAAEFLENSLNISETSRNLYMHRNTLMYRLDKIERITGLNIRNFSDAVSFRVITILYKLLYQ